MSFDEMVGRFMVGFVTSIKISILTPQTPHEKLISYFYSNHVNQEPIISAENKIEGDGFEGMTKKLAKRNKTGTGN